MAEADLDTVRYSRSSTFTSIDSDSVSFDYGASLDEEDEIVAETATADTSVFQPTLHRTASSDTEFGINDSITNFSLLSSALYDAAINVSSYFWETAKSVWRRISTSGEAGGKSEEEEVGSVRPASIEGKDEEEKKAKARKKLFNICNELTTTEEAYVYRLGLLVKIKTQTAGVLGPEAARTMFQNIEVVQQFHRDNLLPLLQERIKNWETTPRIGDIMRSLAPFLKLYSQYVKSFELANQTVEAWKQKSSAFTAIVKEVEFSEDYGKVKLQGHMLDPIQRVPRYEMLLREYLKYLPVDDPDRTDAQEALNLVSKAASHFEEDMKRDSRILQLIRLQAQLEGPHNIIDASRDFIMSGHLKQVKTPGRLSEKVLHLFSDILLVSSEVRSIIPGIAERFRVKELMKLHEVQVISGNNLEIPHTFHIKSAETLLELAASNGDEKVKWETAICKQIIISQEKHNSTSRAGTDTVLGQSRSCDDESSSVVKNGFLHISSDNGRSFKKRWFVLTEKGVLASYRNMHEKEPISSVALSNFQMSIGGIAFKKRKMWLLVGEFRTYHLHTSESDEATESWFKTAQELLQAQGYEQEDVISASFSPRQWQLMTENPRMSTVSTDSGIGAESVSNTDI